MRTPVRLLPGVAVLCFLWSSSVRACTLCVSETGERVRAGIFGDDFGYNLFVTILPFSVFLAIVASIHFDWPRVIGRSGQKTSLTVGADASSNRNEGDKSWTKG